MKKSKLAVLLTAGAITLSVAGVLMTSNSLDNLKGATHIDGTPYTLTIDKNTKFTLSSETHEYIANVKTEDNNIIQINMGNCTRIDDPTPYFVLLNASVASDYSDAGYISNPFLMHDVHKYENRITNLKSITVYHDGGSYVCALKVSTNGSSDFQDKEVPGSGKPVEINTPYQNYFKVYNEYYEDLKVSKVVITYDCI